MSGGGQHDPYDDILAVCQKLSMMQPVSVQPLQMQRLQFGTYDASINDFTWGPDVRSKDRTVVEWEVGSDGKPHKTTYTVTDYSIDSLGVVVQLVVNLVHNASGTTFTAGGQNAFAPPNQGIISVQAPFSGDFDFTRGSTNNNGLGFTVHADRSRFSNFSGSLQQPGCIVIPALPIAVVYQPPTNSGKGSFNTSQSTGVSVTNVLSSATGGTGGLDPTTSLYGITAAVLVLQEIAAAAALAGGPYGTAISAVASVLSAFLQALTSAGESPEVFMEVLGSSTMTLTFAQENTFYSSPELGPGSGDVIVYLQDATFAVYGINGNYTLVPFGFRGLTPIAVPAASLRLGAQQPADLPESLKASLLALDPVASGDPNGVTDTSRYSFVEELTLPYQLEQDFCWSFTTAVSTAGPKLISETNSDGQVVRVVLGPSRGTSQASTIKTCLNVTGPAHFEIWYDSLFDTFANQDIQQVQSNAITNAVSFEGTLDQSQSPLKDRVVTIVQNGRKVSTLTDAQGHYLLHSLSLQPGLAEILLPIGGGGSIAQTVTLSF
jgi:hypothetical protein